MTTASIVVSLAVCIVFVAIMVIAAIIDMNTLRIPNVLIAFACVVWVVEHIVLLAFCGFFADVSRLFASSDSFTAAFLRALSELGACVSGFGSHAPTVGSAVLGALALGAGSLVLSVLYEKVTGKPSMGGGDIKLLFVAGLYLGWWRGFFCVIIACMAFLVLSAFLTRVGWRAPVHDELANEGVPFEEDGELPEVFGFPFGPAIAAGALIALVLP